MKRFVSQRAFCREQKGFTQKTLAEATGLSLRTIQRLEAGNSEPKGHTLTVLAKALATSEVKNCLSKPLAI